MEGKGGPTTELVKSLVDSLSNLGYEYIEEGNVYEAITCVGVENVTLRTVLSDLVEDLQSYGEVLGRSKTVADPLKPSKVVLDHNQKESFVTNLIKYLTEEGYEFVVTISKLNEEAEFNHFLNKATLLESLAGEVTALKLLVARKAFSEQHPSPAQLLEEALAAPSSKKKEEKEKEDKANETEFLEPVKQSVPSKQSVREIYSVFHDNHSRGLVGLQSATDILKEIEKAVKNLLQFFPADYLVPLLSPTFTAEQIDKINAINEGFKKDYEGRRRVVVKRFFSTLRSLLQSKRLDGIRQKVLASYANKHIRLYLNSHPSIFVLYDVLMLKKDALVEQFEAPRNVKTNASEEVSAVKTVIIKGLERPKTFLTVSKTKKKNLKKRAAKKKKWAVDADDENTSLPAQADLLEDGGGGDDDDDEGDDEPLNDEEEVERQQQKEEEKKERKQKREEDTKKQLEEIQKLKETNKGQRLSKKEKMLLKQKEKLTKRQERQKRKVEKVKEANLKQKKEDEDEDGEEGEHGEEENEEGEEEN